MCAHTNKNRPRAYFWCFTIQMCGQRPSGAPKGTKSKCVCVCVCVSVCVDVCLCCVGPWAKLKVGFEAGGPLWRPPSGELGISRESGKNIPTVINQNFCDTNDQKQRSALHPCHRVTSAPQPCPTHLRRCPIGPRRTPPDAIGPPVPVRNRDPISANWVFVIAQSVVALWENET